MHAGEYVAETGLYYLQSRYYDPQTGRFINADGFASTGQGLLGHNMFAYCQNNPVNYYEINGYFLGALIGAAVGGIGGLIGGGISAAIKGEDILAGMASGALGGAVGGAIAGTIVEVFVSPATSVGSAALIGAGAGILGGIASSTISQSSNYYFQNGTMSGFKMDWQSVAVSALTGAAFNAFGAGFGQSQALFYNYENIISAITGGFFSVGNAIADSIDAILFALISQTQDAVSGKTANPYNLSAYDSIRLQIKRAEFMLQNAQKSLNEAKKILAGV